jgi:hypothetical protein
MFASSNTTRGKPPNLKPQATRHGCSKERQWQIQHSYAPIAASSTSDKTQRLVYMKYLINLQLTGFGSRVSEQPASSCCWRPCHPLLVTIWHWGPVQYRQCACFACCLLLASTGQPAKQHSDSTAAWDAATCTCRIATQLHVAQQPEAAAAAKALYRTR